MNRSGRPGIWIFTAIVAAVVLALWLLSRENYPLFHSIAELFSIVIAFGIFMIAWNSREFLENDYLLFIGIAYFFVGSVDLVHTVSYKGMGVIPGSGVDLATKLWVGARSMEAVSLLAAVIFIKRKVRVVPTVVSYFVVTVILFLSVFKWNVFPVVFVEGAGLTVFKKSCEYAISGVLLAALFGLYKNRGSFGRDSYRLIAWSIAVTIASELSFTFYVDAFGFLNFTGHMLKIASFYLIYKAIIEKGFRQPSGLLFRELNESRGRLAEANEELSHFAYVVSHDLKAPLRAINTLSSIIAADCGGSMTEEGKLSIELMQQRVRRMHGLIDGVLQYSRAGRSEERVERVDLNELVNQVVDTLSPPPEMSVTIEGILPTLLCGRTRISQVFQNLIGNALKYNDKPRGDVKIGCENRDGSLVFHVTDNGPGIDERHFERIFQLFQTLKSRDEQESTGVGLAIVRRIVQSFSGRIWVESRIGEGSTFFFTIPDAIE